MLNKLQNNNNMVNSDEESSQFEIDAVSSPSINVMQEDLSKSNSIQPSGVFEEDPDKELASIIYAPEPEIKKVQSDFQPQNMNLIISETGPQMVQ